MLCILSIAINVASFAGSLPVDAQGMLGWQAVGLGYRDEFGFSRVATYLVEDPDHVTEDTRYLLFDETQAVPAAGTAESVCASLLGLGLFAVGSRCFGRMELTGRAFEVARVRELEACSGLAIAAAVVPGLVGWGVTTAAYTMFLTHEGASVLWAPWDTDTVDVWALALGVFLLLAVRSFEYGCALQDQDDHLL